jgi:hypothetical protein
MYKNARAIRGVSFVDSPKTTAPGGRGSLKRIAPPRLPPDAEAQLQKWLAQQLKEQKPPNATGTRAARRLPSPAEPTAIQLAWEAALSKKNGSQT